MEKFFSGAKLQIIFHTLAFLPLFCIKQEQNIFLERKRVLIREHKEHANKSQRGRRESAADGACSSLMTPTGHKLAQAPHG